MIGFGIVLIAFSFALFLQLIIRDLGFIATCLQLLTVLPFAVLQGRVESR